MGTSTIDLLRTEIEDEKKTLMDVATQESQIGDVNKDYQARRKRIKKLCRQLGVEHPVPWSDLWLWYSHWSDHLPTWKERRAYVIKLYEPLLDKLDELDERQLTEIGETGWAKVDLQIQQLQDKFRAAATTEEFNAVAYLARSILISLADAVYEPARHDPEDGNPPKWDDAKNKINRVLSIEFPGESNEKLRKYVRALWDYVNVAAHSKSADKASVSLAANGALHLVQVMRTLIPPLEEQAGSEQESEWAAPTPTTSSGEWGAPSATDWQIPPSETGWHRLGDEGGF